MVVAYGSQIGSRSDLRIMSRKQGVGLSPTTPETRPGMAIATSPATMAYMTTETGVATMIIMVLVAG